MFSSRIAARVWHLFTAIETLRRSVWNLGMVTWSQIHPVPFSGSSVLCRCWSKGTELLLQVCEGHWWLWNVSAFISNPSLFYTTYSTWTSWHQANSDQMNELRVANLLIHYLEGTISKGQAIKCQEDHQKEVMLGRTLKGRNMPSGREKDTWVHIKIICKQYKCKRKHSILQKIEMQTPGSWDK